MTPTIVFDIETIPDIAGLRKVHGIGVDSEDALTDEQVADFAFQRQRQKNGSDFLPLHLHRVVAISCTLRDRDSFRVWSLGEINDGEGVLIQRFFDGIEKYTPQLVSWNGGGFDLPVLHYRGLVHGVRAARYWDQGEGEYHDSRDFKWNNYISRYHARHTDLMDLLSLYQGRAVAPLDDVSILLGFPGKIGVGGAHVWQAWQRGEIAQIRDYCEADVVNTWLVYLKFQLMRGALTQDAYQNELHLVRATLEKTPAPHWQEFLGLWPK